MKISILTFSKEDNNGANLQCYALVHTLKKMGYDVNIVDIQLPPIKSTLASRILRLPQHYNYIKFRRGFIPYFTESFKNEENLKQNLPDSDLYIVGSDQVWNPDITKRLDPLVYFFSFLPDGVRRMAYAASFGVSEWRWEHLKSEVKILLNKFEKISVREAQGVDLCKNTFGVDAQVVCDPTLLLESYNEICGAYNAKKQANELLYFKFTRDALVEDILLDKVKRHRMKMVKLGDFHPRQGCVFRPYYSIKGWLNNIRYARFIVTDSFHCMVFCILFNKQFVVMPSSASRSNRMTNLLNQLGLQDRYCSDEKELQERFDTLFKTEINYDDAKLRIQKIRQQGLDFLRNIEITN